MMHNYWNGGFLDMGFGMLSVIAIILLIGIMIGYVLGRVR